MNDLRNKINGKYKLETLSVLVVVMAFVLLGFKNTGNGLVYAQSLGVGPFSVPAGLSALVNCSGNTRLSVSRVNSFQVRVNCAALAVLPSPTTAIRPTVIPVPTIAPSVTTAPVPTGVISVGDAGYFGVGSGSSIQGNLQVGINMARFNAIKQAAQTDVAYRTVCPSHDPNKWHTLVDPVRKCHYDHHHGDDPHFVADLLGQPGAWFGDSGRSISYPWMTFNFNGQANNVPTASSQMENDYKHEGYYWVVRRGMPCNGIEQQGGLCVRDYRVLFHMAQTTMDFPVRFHSYSMEAIICRENGAAPCGVYRIGGWMDTGVLARQTTPNGALTEGCAVNGPEAGTRVSLPSDEWIEQFECGTVGQNQSRCSNPGGGNNNWRCHQAFRGIQQLPAKGSAELATWFAHDLADRARYQISFFDPIAELNPANPASPTLTTDSLLCTGVNCRHTGSMVNGIPGYAVVVADRGGHTVDSNNDGVADLRGYTNRWGERVSGCTRASLDCVPVEMSAPVGAGRAWSPGINQCYNTGGCLPNNYDFTPTGLTSWVTWFQRHVGM